MGWQILIEYHISLCRSDKFPLRSSFPPFLYSMQSFPLSRQVCVLCGSLFSDIVPTRPTRDPDESESGSSHGFCQPCRELASVSISINDSSVSSFASPESSLPTASLGTTWQQNSANPPPTLASLYPTASTEDITAAIKFLESRNASLAGPSRQDSTLSRVDGHRMSRERFIAQNDSRAVNCGESFNDPEGSSGPFRTFAVPPELGPRVDNPQRLTGPSSNMVNPMEYSNVTNLESLQSMSSDRSNTVITNRDSTSSYASSIFDANPMSHRSSVSTIESQRSAYTRNSANIRGTISSSANFSARDPRRNTSSSMNSDTGRPDIQYQCTHVECRQTFTTKRAWIRHEEEFHNPQYVYTCRLNDSLDLSVEVCPDRSHRSVMNAHHLENLHNSAFCCNETPSNHDRFQTSRDDKLLPHLRNWHGLNLDRIPQSWKRPVGGATRIFGCGFCVMFLASWKERGDHIGDHFSRGWTMEQWSEGVVQQGLRMRPTNDGRLDGILETSIRRLSLENVDVDEVAEQGGSASMVLLVDPRLARDWNEEDVWG
jgi:hypothetical protein